MARPRLHTRDELLDVAERLVTNGDPSGLTVRSLATTAGASNGSIYHACDSKDQLLAQLWLRASARLGNLMDEAITKASEGAREETCGKEAVVAVALASIKFIHQFPTSARLFFAQRRDQHFPAQLPPDIEAELAATHERFTDLLIMLAKGVWSRGGSEAVEAIAVCVVDLPTGILLRCILENRGIDDATRARLDAATRATLTVPLPPQMNRPNSHL